MTMAGRSRSSRRQRANQQAATTDAFANAFVPPTAAAPAAAAANAQDTVINLRPHDDDYGVCDWGVSRRQHDNTTTATVFPRRCSQHRVRDGGRRGI